MKIGLLSDRQFEIRDTQDRGWETFSFTISNDNLSFFEIFSSAFATPARYIEEIYRRLALLEPRADRSPTLIFNPRVEIGTAALLRVLDAVRKIQADGRYFVLVDRENQPLAYLLPTGLDPRDVRFLALLSTTDGALDTQLLRTAFPGTAWTETVTVPLLLPKNPGNGFSNRDASIYTWITSTAITSLSGAGDRNDLATVAIMPHHAGDVLFFALAHAATRTDVSGVAVNKAYQPIVERVNPFLRCVTIDAPVINRSGNLQEGKVTPEYEYFHAIKSKLPAATLYNYCRTERDYNATTFHLLDHFAFALGRSFFSRPDLLSQQRKRPATTRPSAEHGRFKVLLHLDAGWPLKVLPAQAQRELANRLMATGHSVTVLGTAELAGFPCETVTFRNLAQLDELLTSHHVVVGMDSFPCHFAAHVLGLPTICLFSSTRLENSNAPAGPDYAQLAVGLSCSPCYAMNVCPRFGGGECRNFVSADVVAGAIERMLETAYVATEGSAANRGTDRTPAIVYQDSAAPVVPNPRATRLRIWLNHLRLQAAFASLVPDRRRLARLATEFAAATRREGLARTCLRALRFLIYGPGATRSSG